jgi:hypothetical protein
MNRAVSYAYVHLQENRPSLMDQVMACRDYAKQHGYDLVGEFNDIDTSDHPNQYAGMEALQTMLAEDPETVVLSYQLDPGVQERLKTIGARLEVVPMLASRAVAQH